MKAKIEDRSMLKGFIPMMNKWNNMGVARKKIGGHTMEIPGKFLKHKVTHKPSALEKIVK